MFRGRTSTSDRIRDRLKKRSELRLAPEMPYDIEKASRMERAAYTHEESLAGVGRISHGGFQRHPSKGLRLDYTDIPFDEYMAERARLRKKLARTRGDRLLPDHLRVRTDLPYNFPSDIGKAAYTHEESRAGVGRVAPRTSDDVFRAIEESRAGVGRVTPRTSDDVFRAIEEHSG
jgi:hypothetical protein